MFFRLLSLLGSLLCAICIGPPTLAAPPVKKAKLGETQNVHQVGNLFLAGQPTKADFQILKARKIKRVITLRADDEIDWNEADVAEAAGMEFVKLPIGDLDAMNDKMFDRVRKLLRQSEKRPTLLHCATANRVGAVWLVYRVLDQGVTWEQAVKEAKTVGMRKPIFETKARAYIEKNRPLDSPSLNSSATANSICSGDGCQTRCLGSATLVCKTSLPQRDHTPKPRVAARPGAAVVWGAPWASEWRAVGVTASPLPRLRRREVCCLPFCKWTDTHTQGTITSLSYKSRPSLTPRTEQPHILVSLP